MMLATELIKEIQALVDKVGDCRVALEVSRPGHDDTERYGPAFSLLCTYERNSGGYEHAAGEYPNFIQITADL